jgi:cell division transport system permease protein
MSRALVSALAAIRRTPVVQAVAVGTIAVALLFVGMVRIAALNLGRMARSWGDGVQVTVYLEDGVAPAREKKIADALVALPGVATVKTVDGHEAYARLKKSLGDRGALLDGVEDGLLPTSMEVSFREGLAGAVERRPELERLRRTPGVEEVEMMGDWVDRLVAAERLLSVGALLLGLLVGVACLYVVGSTIRLGVYARREEIEILQLVGATEGFVRAPFLVEGALQGAFGASLALGLLYGLYRAAAPVVERGLGAALCSVRIGFLPPREIAAALVLGTLLGLVGSNLAVGRHLRARG